jgi:hypothetical protein
MVGALAIMILPQPLPGSGVVMGPPPAFAAVVEESERLWKVVHLDSFWKETIAAIAGGQLPGGPPIEVSPRDLEGRVLALSGEEGTKFERWELRTESEGLLALCRLGDRPIRIFDKQKDANLELISTSTTRGEWVR